MARAAALLSLSRRCTEDERLVAALLGTRKRGFLLDLVASTGGKERRQGDLESGYPKWKKVVQRLPGLQELRESLASLGTAVVDTTSDKWLSRYLVHGFAM